MKLLNKNVTVMGLGRFGGGLGVTRWLLDQGAKVLLTDLANEDETVVIKTTYNRVASTQ